jgi:DNA (cytosine-5)-methyltransferase 1
MKENVIFNNISLFSGALGLDLGLERAGFKTLVAVEINSQCANTIRMNRPSIRVLQKDIRQVSTNEILQVAGVRRGEIDLLSGGPPCQSFSTAGKRGSIRDIRGQLFLEFLRVVRESRPRFFIIENVRGILSAPILHKPLDDGEITESSLMPSERPGSAIKYLLSQFAKIGYTVTYGLANAADFGVPQIRKRVFFIGSRNQIKIKLPIPTHTEKPTAGKEKWRVLSDALMGLDPKGDQSPKIPPSRIKYLKKIRAGGNWKDLPLRLQKQALGGAYHSGGGKTGFLRRLSFSRPAPTLVTWPYANATSLYHPIELRTLSIREYARIQQFPDDWKLYGTLAQQFEQIGNAVPIGLGYAFGKAIYDSLLELTMKIPQ